MATDIPVKKYIFIDESGDPVFYGNRKKLLVGTPGFQPYLIIGMIETTDRRALYKAVAAFMQQIKADNLYNTIPSVACDKGWYLHARADHPEVRAKFIELLRSLDGYKAHIVIAKKDLNIFTRKHNNNATEFYFDVLHHLLNGKIHSEEYQHMLYLAQRGNNTLHQFQKAVDKALLSDDNATNGKVNYELKIIASNEMPELSIIDYLMWALQRKLLTGESRFFDTLAHQYGTIIDLYNDEVGA